MAIDLKRVSQIGLIVPNLEDAAANWAELLGRPPDRFSITPDGEKIYYGESEDFCAKIAIFVLENIQIELIEPIRGESVWKDFLNKTGGGLHHIQFYCDHYAEDKTAISDFAGEIVQQGPSVRGPNYHFGYFDTVEKLSCMIEILNAPEKCD